MEPLKVIKKADALAIPEWIQELAGIIGPHISRKTRFVCLTQDPNMGDGKRMDERAVTICSSREVKNIKFETDGTYIDSNRQRYKDGHVCDRTVKGFKYIVVENMVLNDKGEGGQVSVCYVTDKLLLLVLRQGVGLPGW